MYRISIKSIDMYWTSETVQSPSTNMKQTQGK